MNRFAMLGVAVISVACQTKDANKGADIPPSNSKDRGAQTQQQQIPGMALNDLPFDVYLQPFDLMTDVGATPLVVRVRNGGLKIEPSILDALAKNISLQDGAGNPIKFSTVVNLPQELYGPNGAERDTAYEVAVVPESKLSGWFSLGIADLPPPLKWPANFRMRRDSTRGGFVRFSTETGPVFSELFICEKEGQKNIAYVRFSENVDANAKVHLLLGESACEQRTPSSSDGPQDSLAFDCQSRPSTEVSLKFSGDIRSLSGAALTSPPSFSGTPEGVVAKDVVFKSSDGVASDGCVVFRP